MGVSLRASIARDVEFHRSRRVGVNRKSRPQSKQSLYVRCRDILSLTQGKMACKMPKANTDVGSNFSAAIT